MTDIADDAQQHEELNLQQSLQAHQAVAANTPRQVAQGYCLNRDCEDEFEPGDQRLFCNAACADNHHRLTKPR